MVRDLFHNWKFVGTAAELLWSLHPKSVSEQPNNRYLIGLTYSDTRASGSFAYAFDGVS